MVPSILLINTGLEAEGGARATPPPPPPPPNKDDAVLCPGNPEHKFIAICQARGGAIKGERGCGDIVAFVDHSLVFDASGNYYQERRL